MVNPIIEGRGLKNNNFLEVFGMRVPVVSTALGVEALDVLDGQVCRIVDDARGFAEAVLELIDEPGRASRMVGRAHGLVTTRFTREAVGRVLERVVEQAFGGSATAESARRPVSTGRSTGRLT